ncbi:SWIM zinc finger family protein [Streptomyces sp. 8L]|uniref:SWIM zinc finger family protein n=1 Tax=Streptomyces sp. 8L TaxID=2877242 RepID=UPI001CD4A287|nr:SWIM zinc finger family protein [Streptomyces sp. 8L]MCA1222654.1 SWIM zinc finger domain-containing protein [Streptomyces sp. 8L]
MTDLGVRRTAEQVLALAPDDASRRAGSKLGSAGPWSQTGAGAEGAPGAVWGLCKGSGSKPYQTVVDTAGPAYKCSCPSRKFPCKHALGLLLLRASAEDGFVTAQEPPDWAREWLAARAKREDRTKRPQRAEPAEGTEGPGAAGGAGPAKSADPEAARRRAERRAARITAGVGELERRLADLLASGLAGAEQSGGASRTETAGGYGPWEETAARMVDAQAPGLAARARELGAIPASGPGWPGRLLEESALLHLLDRAWLGVGSLPEPLATTVRTRVGLASVSCGEEVRDRWSVLAQYDTSDGKLTTRRIWLHGRASGRWALVLGFGAGGRAPEPALPVGLAVDARLAPHAGAGQLRASWVGQSGAPEPIGPPPPGGPVSAAAEAYGTALGSDPWLDAWPVVLSDVIPLPPGERAGWRLRDADGGAQLPLTARAVERPGLWRLVALAGGRPVTVFGECGHRGFEPMAAWSPTDPAMVTLI